MANTITNIQWGFQIGDTGMLTLAGTDVGFIEDRIVLRQPRQYAYLNVDLFAVELDQTLVLRECYLSAVLSEVSLASLVAGWDTNAASGSTLDSDKDTTGSIAVVVTTKSVSGGTRTITLSTAVATGDGIYTMPVHDKQIFEVEFKGLGDTAADGRVCRIVDS